MLTFKVFAPKQRSKVLSFVLLCDFPHMTYYTPTLAEHLHYAFLVVKDCASFFSTIALDRLALRIDRKSVV